MSNPLILFRGVYMYNIGFKRALGFPFYLYMCFFYRVLLTFLCVVTTLVHFKVLCPSAMHLCGWGHTIYKLEAFRERNTAVQIREEGGGSGNAIAANPLTVVLPLAVCMFHHLPFWVHFLLQPGSRLSFAYMRH